VTSEQRHVFFPPFLPPPHFQFPHENIFVHRRGWGVLWHLMSHTRSLTKDPHHVFFSLYHKKSTLTSAEIDGRETQVVAENTQEASKHASRHVRLDVVSTLLSSLKVLRITRACVAFFLLNRFLGGEGASWWISERQEPTTWVHQYFFNAALCQIK